MLRSSLLRSVCTGILVLLAGCATQSAPKIQPNGSPAPMVAGVANQVNGVAPNRAIAVVFSEPMNPKTINAQTFYIQGVTGAVSYDATSRTATLKPDRSLAPTTQYTAVVTTGASSLAGAPMAQNYTFSFTTRATADTSPIKVMSTTPANGAACVDVNTKISVTFSEGVDPSTINGASFYISGVAGTVTYDAVNIIATFTPSAPLQQNTKYTGTLTTAIADLASIALPAPISFSFTTGPCSGGGGGTGTGNTFVYVSDAAANSSTDRIAGFQIAADGTASAVPGSPFAFHADFLTASPSGNFLFGDFSSGPPPNTGSEYFTYAVAANGSLSTASSTTQVPPDPNGGGAGGPTLISMDRTGATLYGELINGSASTGDQWLAEYGIGSSGSLSLLGSTDAKDAASQISFTPDNRFGFYLTVGPISFPSPTIVSVVRNPDGTLSNSRGLQLTEPTGLDASYQPWSAVVAPNSNYLAVLLQSYVYPNQKGLALYPINSDGTLGTPTPLLPLPSAYSVTWDSTGTYLFSTNGSQIYEIRFDATLKTIALVGTTASPAYPVTFLNGHLFALTRNPSNLYVYNFSNGVLTPAPGLPVPLGFNDQLALAALQH